MRLRLTLPTLAVLPVLVQSLVSAQAPITYTPEVLPSRTVNRILEQGTWGPTPAGSLILQRKGFEAWFTSQLAAPISTYNDQPLLNPTGLTNNNVGPVQTQFFQNAVNGPDQLRQRVAFALSKIWVVSENEINNATAFPPNMRLFQQDAFSNYEQIMTDVTLNPAMGRYLNMVNNDKANPVKGTSANENYGREIMQLFTLGLVQLNPDGSTVMDAQGVPVPAYTQTTVTAVARAFTGWTYAPLAGATSQSHNPTNYFSPMVATQANHDTAQKMLFPGFSLPAGQTAEVDLQQTLHAIFMQPGLPAFVCRQIIQNLTTSNPSPAYIQRVSEVFTNNGAGVRGDMTSVLHAILLDPEARAGDDPNSTPASTYGHMREPVLLTAALLRGLSGTVANTSTVANYISGLGQQLFYAPSVFSYFSPLFRTSDGLLAPEFQIYSTQSATNRINLINSAIYGGKFDAGTTFNINAFITAAADPAVLVSYINALFFHGAMSDALTTAINNAMGAVTAPADKAKAALYIALSSSEYQVID